MLFGLWSCSETTPKEAIIAPLPNFFAVWLVECTTVIKSLGTVNNSNKTWHVWICVVDEVYMGTVNIAT